MAGRRLRPLGAAASAAAAAAASGAAATAAAGAADPGLLDISDGADIIVVGAGSASVDGTYSCLPPADDERGPCVASEKKSAYDIKWYEAAYGNEVEPLWPSAWYLELALGKEGLYYMDAGNRTYLPLGTWKVWSGRMSSPGREPAPAVMEVNSMALQAPLADAAAPGDEAVTRRSHNQAILGSCVLSGAVLFLGLLLLIKKPWLHFSRREVGHNLMRGDAKEDDDMEE